MYVGFAERRGRGRWGAVELVVVKCRTSACSKERGAWRHVIGVFGIGLSGRWTEHRAK